MASPVVVLTWRAFHSAGSLRGFATIKLPSGLVCHDFAVHRSGESWRVLPPSRPRLDHEGRPTRDETGRIQRSPVVSFADPGTHARFSDVVIDALRAAFPEALT
jgi:hypothetical protein